MNTCKSCEFWRPRQAELDYDTFTGICVCYLWKFDSASDSNDVTVLDRDNRSSKYRHVQRFESQSINVPIGDVDRSTYCLVTGENFGCIHYQSVKTKKNEKDRND